jgi:hypothetical protein
MKKCEIYDKFPAHSCNFRYILENKNCIFNYGGQSSVKEKWLWSTMRYVYLILKSLWRLESFIWGNNIEHMYLFYSTKICFQIFMIKTCLNCKLLCHVRIKRISVQVSKCERHLDKWHANNLTHYDLIRDCSNFNISYAWIWWDKFRTQILMTSSKLLQWLREWLQKVFGLVIGFIGPLKHLPTTNYSPIANSHRQQFTTSPSKSSQPAVSSPVVF